MYVSVQVRAGAKKEIVKKESDRQYMIAVKEPAERNLANRRVQTLLARECGVLPNEVVLVSGHRSPKKVFTINK